MLDTQHLAYRVDAHVLMTTNELYLVPDDEQNINLLRTHNNAYDLIIIIKFIVVSTMGSFAFPIQMIGFHAENNNNLFFLMIWNEHIEFRIRK